MGKGVETSVVCGCPEFGSSPSLFDLEDRCPPLSPIVSIFLVSCLSSP